MEHGGHPDAAHRPSNHGSGDEVGPASRGSEGLRGGPAVPLRRSCTTSLGGAPLHAGGGRVDTCIPAPPSPMTGFPVHARPVPRHAPDPQVGGRTRGAPPHGSPRGGDDPGSSRLLHDSVPAGAPRRRARRHTVVARCLNATSASWKSARSWRAGNPWARADSTASWADLRRRKAALGASGACVPGGRARGRARPSRARAA